MIIAYLISALILLGAAFFLIAAIGVVRFPDLLTRMHAATKAGAFGGALLLIAAALFFAEAGVIAKCALILLFFYLTAPVAGQMLGRAGYRAKVPLAPQTHHNDLAEDKRDNSAADS